MRVDLEELVVVVLGSPFAKSVVKSLEDMHLKCAKLRVGHDNANSIHQLLRRDQVTDLSAFMVLNNKRGTLMATAREAMRRGVYFSRGTPPNAESPKSK